MVRLRCGIPEWANKRTEMWAKMRDWLGGDLSTATRGSLGPHLSGVRLLREGEG